MPLPSDERVVQLANELLKVFEILSGSHPGYRPAHAKGILLKGTFTPAREATSLTRAPHIQRASTPVVVRFSDGSGLPMIPRSEEHTSELQSRQYLVCRLLLEKKQRARGIRRSLPCRLADS